MTLSLSDGEREGWKERGIVAPPLYMSWNAKEMFSEASRERSEEEQKACVMTTWIKAECHIHKGQDTCTVPGSSPQSSSLLSLLLFLAGQIRTALLFSSLLGSVPARSYPGLHSVAQESSSLI